MVQNRSVATTPQLERDAIRGDLLGAQAQLTGGGAVSPTGVPVLPQPIAPNVVAPQLSGAVPAMPVNGLPAPNDPCTLLQARLGVLIQLMTPLGQELGSALAATDPSGVLHRQGVRPTTLQDILEEPETLAELARFIEEELLAGRSGANPDLVTLREVADNIRALDQDPTFRSNLSVFDHLQQAAEVIDDQSRAVGCLPDPPIGQAAPAQTPLPQEA